MKEKCTGCHNMVKPIEYHFSELTVRLQCPVCFVIWYKERIKQNEK